MSEGKKPVATVKASFKKETVPAAAALGTKTAEVKKPEASKAVSAKKPAAGNDKKEVTKRRKLPQPRSLLQRRKLPR